MTKKNGLRTAHAESVNSVFVSFDAGVVISVDEDSIRIWDPVNGTEIYQTGMSNEDDSVIPGLGSIYRFNTDLALDS